MHDAVPPAERYRSLAYTQYAVPAVLGVLKEAMVPGRKPRAMGQSGRDQNPVGRIARRCRWESRAFDRDVRCQLHEAQARSAECPIHPCIDSK
jgi:hypothetical protein